MVKVKYTGTSNYREISAADWKSLGIEGQGKTVWDRDNARGTVGAKQVHELTDEAAQWLLDNEPEGHFEIIEEEQVSEPPTDTTATGNPDATLAPPDLGAVSKAAARRIKDQPQA